MPQTTIRVDSDTRDRLQAVAAKDFGGISTDAAIQRLLDQHWKAQAIKAMDDYRREHPEEWDAEVDESERMDAGADLPLEPYDVQAS
ncbi:MAG TPA: hypothetical protein VFO77_10240 [Actinoplanes sp.]|nr:hypothetical protein [Actinoplanes sp.]